MRVQGGLWLKSFEGQQYTTHYCIFFPLSRVYTEEQPGDAAIMLFIKNLKEDDSGIYTCQGIYANNEEIFATVKVSTFSGLSLIKLLQTLRF